MSPNKVILRAIARRAKIENAAAAAQVRLLTNLRRAILQELVTAEGFRIFRLQTMLRAVDHEIQRYRTDAAQAIAGTTRDAWEAGAAMVIEAPAALYGLSPQLLQALIDVTSDQVRAVWSELGTRLKVQIRQVTLGLTEPFEAMGRVAKLIKDPKSFGTAFTRVEAIVRTEVNRTFSMSTHGTSIQLDQRLALTGERLAKWWLSAEDNRVRPAHAQAAKDYTRTKPIPIDQPFIVGGEEMLHPHDPNASAENVVNCRCVEVTVVLSAEQFATLARAA